jgi:hypothetical protein
MCSLILRNIQDFLKRCIFQIPQSIEINMGKSLYSGSKTIQAFMLSPIQGG